MNKIIVRIIGGLGNQLFSYAAARRLALVNRSELIIDDITGFVRDQQYMRKYALDHFSIPCRKATPWERMEPFERYRRGVVKLISRKLPFNKRSYIEQSGNDFDERMLSLKPKGGICLEGLWQSEQYFKDIEEIIREDLRIIPPEDKKNQDIFSRIKDCNAVALHVRWFDHPEAHMPAYNISADYYKKAIKMIRDKINRPHFFIFSDHPEFAEKKLLLRSDEITIINHNTGDENAYADMWLMSQCRHFITANSTFSWWGAWLGSEKGKIIITPDVHLEGKTSWGFKGLIPDNWIKL